MWKSVSYVGFPLLILRQQSWKRTLHWWLFQQMIVPHTAVTVFLRPFLNCRYFEATIFPMQR